MPFLGALARALLLLLCWVVPAVLPAAAQPAPAPACPAANVIDVADRAGAIRASGAIAVLDDPGRGLDLSAVRAQPGERWHTERWDHLRLGYEFAAVWLRLCLANTGPEDRVLVLSLEPPQINWIDFYWLVGDRVLDAWRTGDQRPFGTRPVDYRAFAFPLAIPAGAAREALLRLDMRDGIYPSLRIQFSEADRFLDGRQRTLLYWGAYYGVVLALLAYNLLLYASTRDRSFLLYDIYLALFGVLGIGAFGGFGFQWLWPNHPEWNRLFDTALPTLILIPATAFTAECLATRERSPRLHRLMLAGTVAAQLCPLAELVLMAVPGLAFAGAAVLLVVYFMVVSTAMSVLYLAIGVVVLRGGYAPARFFVFAWTFTILGVLVHRLVRIPDLLPANFLTENAIVVGTTFEFLLLALALGDRYNRIREDALATERRLSEERRANAAILEERVRERTRELDQAMTRVRHALELERRARHEQREFLATVSHELRTPLTLVDTIAQNLLLDDEPGAQRHARYTKILRATERMSGLLQDYLDEERFTLLRQGAKRVPTDLRQLLDDAAAAARVLADGQTVAVDGADLPATFDCDPELTGLALRSLADNAVRHTPPGTTVTLRGRPEGHRAGDGIQLEVADDGPGLPPDEVAHVFEPGFRGRGAAQKPGRGMGLALARHNVECQGGTLTVASGPGRGCRFVIGLPGRAPA